MREQKETGKEVVKKPKSDETKITRIKASDDAAASKPARIKKPVAAEQAADRKEQGERTEKKHRKNVFRAFHGYLKGSWYELRQVRWPDRRSTWAMTGALLIFTTFFVVIILLLDTLFKYLFQLLLGL